jgi:hypothetical protein
MLLRMLLPPLPPLLVQLQRGVHVMPTTSSLQSTKSATTWVFLHTWGQKTDRE